MDYQQITEPGDGSGAWRHVRRVLTALACAVLLGGVVLHAGVSRSSLQSVETRLHGRAPRRLLRVWDWCAPATDEKFGYYFDAVKREFEAAHPDVEVDYQFIPFGQYEQKMATALVGNSPPDVFQCSVYWAEGFYDRGMLLPLND